MSKLLDTALEAATAAGNLLRRKFTQPREVRSKGWRDIVTDADFAAQQVIFSILTRRHPHHAILSEEGRHDVDLNSTTPTWVIDPLDGTTNYSRQLPVFCVSIGLVERGAPRLGVVYDPLGRELFFAEQGRGAFLRAGRGRARRLHVSGVTDIGDALLAMDGSREPGLRQRALTAIPRAGEVVRTVRSFGSAALGLAYLAAGRLEGYYHLSLQPWDVAAGALLVTEAGGRLTTPAGDAWNLGQVEMVASNSSIHGRLVRALHLA